MNPDQLKEAVLTALRSFIERDKRQLGRIRIYEPTMSHRIAVYLEKLELLQDYNVDCEYDRNLLDPKKNLAGKGIRPDIVIHQRIDHNHNLVVMEIKKCGKDSKLGKADIKKLWEMVNGPDYGYRLGVFVGIMAEKLDIVWLEQGSEPESEVINCN